MIDEMIPKTHIRYSSSIGFVFHHPPELTRDAELFRETLKAEQRWIAQVQRGWRARHKTTGTIAQCRADK